MSEFENLEKEIALLPKGYITHRTVNNKVYYYRQGMINGEQFCISVHEKDIESVTQGIKKRKELEKELKELKINTTAETVKTSKLKLTTSTFTGQILRNFADSALKFQKRDCFETIRNYIYGETEDKVCLVYGLRRTGKTTLIKQIISELNKEDFSKTAYIKCKTTDTIPNLNNDIIQLRNSGYRFLFLDEVTLLADFIDSSSLFSDVYAAQGMKIVMSGTDSLGFHFAGKDELYDRAVTVHTTFIPFREHSKLLGIDDIDEYIHYGGTLKAGELDFESKEINAEDASFRDDETTRRYIDTAICSNIQHSLEYFKDGRYFRQLRSLYQADELTNAINRIIEDMNHSFTVKVVTELFKSHDLSSAAQLLRSEKAPSKRLNILDTIDRTSIIEKFKSILSIKEKEEQIIGINDAHFEEIKEYLKTLDLIENIKVETRYPENPKLNSSENYVIFTQPGMRFCQARVLVYSVLSDPQINILSSDKMELIETKILEDVKGKMLEDIVMLETKKSLQKSFLHKQNAFKLRFKDGEFDMVITDSESKTCRLFEIKHSSQREENQCRHLLDSEMTSTVETVYGKITNRTVLYRGKTIIQDNGIEYKNVEEYLKELR